MGLVEYLEDTMSEACNVQDRAGASDRRRKQWVLMVPLPPSQETAAYYGLTPGDIATLRDAIGLIVGMGTQGIEAILCYSFPDAELLQTNWAQIKFYGDVRLDLLPGGIVLKISARTYP